MILSYSFPNLSKSFLLRLKPNAILNRFSISTIEIKENDILNMKTILNKEINDLKNINNLFFDLLEKLKKEFIYLYGLKQKEIEIKQKILHDYEIIKYNYNSIKNVQNIINNNKTNFIFNFKNDKDKNNDILEEINSIFTFMKNNNDIIHNKKEYVISNIDTFEISSMLKLKDNNIAISYFNGFLDIYKNNFELILRKKIFEKNEGINHMFQLKKGDLVLAGKKIKILNLNLENKICDIIHEINNGNGFVDFIHELKNNILIAYDTNHELKLFKNYKLIHNYKNSMSNINNLFKVNDSSFITSSILQNNINLFKLNYKNNIPELTILPLNKEMHIKSGKNSFIKLNDFYFVLIYENKKEKNILEEKFEETKNNEENKKENGLCLIQLNPENNNFEILQKIENLDEKKNYTNLVGYLKEEFMLLNDQGFFEIWRFDNVNKNIFMKNRIDIFYNDGIIINIIYLEETSDFIFQTNKNIFMLSNY